MSKLPHNRDEDVTLINPSSPPSKAKAASPAPLIPVSEKTEKTENTENTENKHGDLSAAQAALRVERLQADARRAQSARGPRPTGSIFKASCASDVLFLIDATVSMKWLIDSVKRQVHGIVNELQDAFFGEADVRLAIVAYRDHETTDPFEWIDFTRDTDAVFRFLDGLDTQQSLDTCEDVVGGLDKALQLSWRHPTRCIMHLGDAPAHGRDNHHLEAAPYTDRFRDEPEPHGMTLAGVAERMIAARINYVFFRMKEKTDRMLFNLFRAYVAAAPDARLSPNSTYAAKAAMVSLGLHDARRRRGGPGHHADDSIAGGLHFEENDLGSGHQALGRLVVRGVAASSSRTAVRLSSSLTTSRARGMRSQQAKAAALGALQEDVETDFLPEKAKDETDCPPEKAKDENDRPPEKAKAVEVVKTPRGGGTATTSASDATLVAGQADRTARTSRAYEDKDHDDKDHDDNEDDDSWQRHLTVPVNNTPPRWNDKRWLDQTLHVKAFSPDVVLRPAGDGSAAGTLLERMMDSDENIPISTTDLTILCRSQPFAQGGLRTVSYARTAASTNPLVVKAFKTPKQLADLVEDMRMQALAKAFALEFNELVGEDQYALDFVVVTCLEPVAASDAGGASCLLLEPLLETNGSAYTKYNNNCGGVSHLEKGGAFTPVKVVSGGFASMKRKALNKVTEIRSAAHVAANAPAVARSMAAQAFSHYTYERSRSRLLVVDLQGVGGVLTDPVVHTRDPARFALSDTNLNADGFKLFFATHSCNAVCRRLGLRDGPTVASALFRADETDGADRVGLVDPGVRWMYRTDWTPTPRPAADGSSSSSSRSAVCCANKLCGRLVPGAAAHTGPPGFAWCARCWPQLAATATTRTCTGAAAAGAAPHAFAVSAFFFESQGQVLPDACAAHGGGAVDPAQFGSARRSLLGRLGRGG